jgi:hypothetical protein
LVFDLFLCRIKAAAAAISPSLLTYLSHKAGGYRERTILCRQWKCRKTSARWSKDNLRAVTRIKLGVMANALKHVLVTRCPLHPCGNGTARVRANCRIGNDAVSGARARVIIEFRRIELNDQHLIQTRAIADHRSIGILGPSPHRWAAEFQILRPDHLTSLFSFRDDKNIGLLRSFVTAGLTLVGSGRSGCQYARSRCESRQNQFAPRRTWLHRALKFRAVERCRGAITFTHSASENSQLGQMKAFAQNLFGSRVFHSCIA